MASLSFCELVLMDDLDILKEEETTLVEILDRVLDKGVVISGDVILSVADIDLVYLGLKVVLSSVETLEAKHPLPNHLKNDHLL